MVLIGLGFGLGSGLGCGGDDEGSRTAPSMVRGESAARGDGPNRAPELTELGIRPASPTPGRVVEAWARASDPDGDVARIRFRWRSSLGETLGEGERLDTSGLVSGDRVELVAVATDGRAESEPAVHAFRLGAPSREISLVAIDGADGARPGSILTAVVETTDESMWSDQELVWLVNGKIAGHDEELDTSSLAPGDVVELRAVLETDQGRSRPVTSRPVVLARGEAPVIVSEPMAGMAGGVFEYRIEARSPVPGAELEYQLLKGPDGMEIDAQRGVVRWRPGAEQRGRFDVEVGVIDGWGTGVAQSFAIQVDPPEESAPPARPR